MAVSALLLYLLWFLLAFGLRTLVQLRRPGDTGWRARGLPGRTGSVEWWAGLLFVVALIVGVGAPMADLAGLEPFAALDRRGVAASGIGIASAGVLLTLLAQLSMGDSWRIGVDVSERTELVTDGAFRVVRNPIFSAMLVTAVGLALMVPNAVALAGLAALIVALELQVRGAEEPYLLRVHGPRYAAYARRVGRFVPRLGRPGPATTWWGGGGGWWARGDLNSDSRPFDRCSSMLKSAADLGFCRSSC
jgi:protein-S-isoprenylcysteine O-methyltransferase Ste14